LDAADDVVIHSFSRRIAAPDFPDEIAADDSQTIIDGYFVLSPLSAKKLFEKYAHPCL
jgi:hypothetical protein